MAHRMHSIFRKTCLDVEETPFSVIVPQSTFLICLKVSKCAPENHDGNDVNNSMAAVKKKAKVELSIEPESAEMRNSGYELIVDYKLVVDLEVKLIERDKWKSKEILMEIEVNSFAIDLLEFFFGVREILGIAGDLSAVTSFRNFAVLNAERTWYVNTNQLNSLGGRLFKEWLERDCQGEKTAVVQSLDVKELDELLTACCSYSTPIVHRRNFHILLEIAEKERIIGLLRLLESFLVESLVVHQIRKLEYAAEHRMTRLATSVLRSFPNHLARLDSLFEYLSENKETISDVHLDVLEMLEIFPEHVVI